VGSRAHASFDVILVIHFQHVDERPSGQEEIREFAQGHGCGRCRPGRPLQGVATVFVNNAIVDNPVDRVRVDAGHIEGGGLGADPRDLDFAGCGIGERSGATLTEG